MAQPTSARRYQAFISYSHAADQRLAPALQQGLHRFANRFLRNPGARVSLDRTNLAISPGLWSSVRQEIDDAAFLILLASPAAAASKWVGREVEYWLAHRSPDTLFIVLTEGDIVYDDARHDFDSARTTALPAALSGAFAEEPIYLDLRWARAATDLSLGNERFRDAVADIAVKLHGGRKDDLLRRDTRQKQMLRRGLAGIATVLAALVVTATVLGWNARQSGRLAASRQLAVRAADAATTDTGRAVQLAVEAVRQAPTTEAIAALRQALISASVRLPHERAAMMPAGVRSHPFTGEAASTDGRLRVKSDEGRTTLEAIDAASNQRLTAFRGHAATVIGIDINPDGTRVASVDDAGVGHVWEVRNGARVFSLRAESTVEGYAAVLWSPDGRLVLAGGNDGKLQAWDSASGKKEWVSEGSVAAVTLIAVSPDSRLVATASDEERPGGRTDLSAYVWDAGSGASHCSGACVFGDPALELTDITFSADSRYLVTSALNGHIVWRAADGAAVLRSLDGGHEYDPRLERGMVAIEAGPVDISGRGVVGIVNVGFDADGVLVTVDAESAHRRWSSPLWELVPDSEAAAANGDWRPTAPPADGFLRSPTGMLTVRLGEPTSAGEVLDPRTGNILTTVRPGSEPVLAAAFSPDGTWLALADGTRSVRLHRWETLAPLDRLQERAAQLVDPLDPAERARLVPSVWQRLNAWLGVVTRRRVARASGRPSMRPAREASFPPVPSRAGPRPRARA